MAWKLPPVTIGIVFYNAASTLLDAVRSVFAQTHQDWELILIDDGSSDQSLEIARAINDPRVRVFSDGQNKRLGTRLNQITQLATHDFIARMDADDLMTPDRIEKLLGILVANDKYDLISCGTYSIRFDKSLRGYRGKAQLHYSFEGLLNKSQEFLHAGLVARKSWYQRNCYQDLLPAGEDALLWLTAVKSGDFRAMSTAEPLYMYREEGNVVAWKLLAAYKIERTKIAPLIQSPGFRLFYVAKSLAKTSIVWTLRRSGLLIYLLNLRNRKVSALQLKLKFESACREIAVAKIPGTE